MSLVLLIGMLLELDTSKMIFFASQEAIILINFY
jgi:hypothetical protein